MRALNLFIRLSPYCLGIALLSGIALYFFPDAQYYIPVGGAETLLSGASDDPFATIEVESSQISGELYHRYIIPNI